MTFDDLVTPVSSDAFVREYLGRQYLLVKDKAGRFATVVTWANLNETLRHHRWSGMRLRLVLQGTEIAPSSYLVGSGDSSGAYVDGVKVERLLSSGATLIISEVDELYPAVQAVAEACQRQFRIYVSGNLYASWRTSRGFDLHWDDHDTIILQICGRKHWTLYEPTRLHPIRGERTAAPVPRGAPAWEGLLEDGDLLYMPRGWWHVACPVDEPTLHVTLSCRHATGIDLLKWILPQLNRAVEFRNDVPHLRSAAERAEYASALSELIGAHLSEQSIAQFANQVDGRYPARPEMWLPHVAGTSMPTAAQVDSGFKLAVGGRLCVEHGDGEATARIIARGGEVACDPGVIPALRLLRQTHATRLDMLQSAIEPARHEAMMATLRALLANDVVRVEPHCEEPEKALTAKA